MACMHVQEVRNYMCLGEVGIFRMYRCRNCTCGFVGLPISAYTNAGEVPAT